MKQYLKLFTKVEDGLPEKGGTCYVLIKGREENVMYASFYQKWNRSFLCTGYEVTHWLDLSKLTTIEAATEAIRNAYEQGGQDWDYGMDTENYVSKAIKKL